MPKCRRCKINEGTLYYDAQYNKTKTPVCKECLDHLVTKSPGLGGYRPGYVGHSRDPDHDQLPHEHVEAQEWWDAQTNEWD